ncbi:mRNA splicing factor, thioredoxin-like U5 snRNP [Carpediemonas membranifera]|uniref:mRNA splicing factor, thioredoxin-like U5 snRNP n=1 Tax=Carpediemonas membranifera TaxID=201153 RepID=A0A8J6B7K7_9EUKA|nr:mRNA splicing factor, thioredoxin-like U5 snRNP [Carpediemonas membranifera]|eukprot:KAG9394784.1 mRNA splicing factor, thioredoxin-like U5 snRNP [Carpediemonas membranifera]
MAETRDEHGLRHLKSAYQVKQDVLYHKSTVVCLRFGNMADETTSMLDHILGSIQPMLANHASIFAVDTDKVKDFNDSFEIDEFLGPCVIFFYRENHIQVDIGSGDNTRVYLSDARSKQEWINIIERVATESSRGRGIANMAEFMMNVRA